MTTRPTPGSAKPTSQPVRICFHDREISAIFSQLLRGRGVKTEIVEKIVSPSPETKFITEPHYFSQIPPENQAHCLVVGSRQAIEQLPSIRLFQPLTEQKVEAALEQFLR